MRDYLYIWNDIANQCIVASGIEFKDIAGHVGVDGGLVLLSHDVDFFSEYIKRDKKSSFIYVPRTGIPELAKEDIYSWGDFCWVDYAGEVFPELSDREIAELLFFDHMSKPLEKITVPGLHNRYLCYAHDDGWFMRLFYTSWEDITALVGSLYPQLDFEELKKGHNAYWISNSFINVEEQSYDVDAVLNRRLLNE